MILLSEKAKIVGLQTKSGTAKFWAALLVRTAKDIRLFVEAVLYRYRTGMPWRDLPERFGDWKAVHTRFTRSAKAGVRERVFKHLAEDADNEYAMIDSTIVRVHQHSAGAQKKPANTKRSAAAKAD